MHTVQRSEVENLMRNEDNAVLLNVLSEDQFKSEHIPGSWNVPFSGDESQFVEKVESLVPSRDSTVIVYCASTDCPASEKAAECLENAGYTHIVDYEGGMKDWKEGRGAVEGSA